MATKKAAGKIRNTKTAKKRTTPSISRLPKADKGYLPPSYYVRGNHGDS